MSRAAVPVILVAGFLGSGKTTLLNHLLRAGGEGGSVGARIGVLVNDFGSVNIDAMLVAGQADGAVSLSNGCMCCSVDRDGLDTALDTLLRPSARIDAVVIEASGIAEPKSLIRMVAGSDDARLRYGGLIYVVDAPMFAWTRREHPEIDAHVAVADLLVLNKSDLVSDDELASVRADVVALNPTAPHIAVTDARIDPAILFDPVSPPEPAELGAPRQLTLDALLSENEESCDHADDGHRHLHDGFGSVEFTSPEPMDPRRLAGFLERPPTGCYRIKGVAHFDLPGHRQRHVVHGVGGFVEVRREPWSGSARETTIVVIGAGIDRVEVHHALRAAVADAATAADVHGILHITRHLPVR
ncbi:CobW family GTP-binding protein [Gordonia sp. DT30]|uniref:CobW family GTP-binding protein n=1 Tax=Gordonia sp. DT30 TaxID=3416546 RepID=UPI003CEBBEC5